MSSDFLTGLNLRLQGHLKIYEFNSWDDYRAGKHSRVLLNKRNAIHKDNASILVGYALTNRTLGKLRFMAFGNGGSVLAPDGSVTTKPPHSIGSGEDLYNPVFFQMIDDESGATAGNSMSVKHINGSLFSDLEVRCFIDQTQPFGQLSGITETGINYNSEQFKFDEIGLKLADGTLITHVTFVPVLKTAFTLIEVVYTIRVAIGDLDVITPDPVLPPP